MITVATDHRMPHEPSNLQLQVWYESDRPLRRRRPRQRVERGRQGPDRGLGLVGQSVALRKPTRIIVREPCVAGCILPNQHL